MVRKVFCREIAPQSQRSYRRAIQRHRPQRHDSNMKHLIGIRGLTKTYSGVCALDDVSMSLEAGEVHALCGENGAGKSTLIKCLTGVVNPDRGTVEVQGKLLPFGSVAASEAMGIAVIHQEATTFPDLNAVENIFVGRELKNRYGFLQHKKMRADVTKRLDELGQQFDIRVPVSELSLANRQMVMMARALSQDCKLMIMDEPTASLSAQETDVLLKTVRRLRQQGITILYVSHRLAEIFEISDRITVLRDGAFVCTNPAAETNEATLIEAMVGREVHIDVRDEYPVKTCFLISKRI